MLSGGPVLLRDRARVRGDITSASTVTLQNGAVVEHGFAQHTAFPPFSVHSWTAAFGASQGSIVLDPDRATSISAGAYDDLIIGSFRSTRAAGFSDFGQSAHSDRPLRP
jgi:hypothetical protein